MRFVFGSGFLCHLCQLHLQKLCCAAVLRKNSTSMLAMLAAFCISATQYQLIMSIGQSMPLFNLLSDFIICRSAGVKTYFLKFSFKKIEKNHNKIQFLKKKKKIRFFEKNFGQISEFWNI